MLDNNQDFWTTQTIRRWVVSLSLLIACVFGLYFWRFAGSLSTNREVWGQFGDYVGGVLNPLLTLASVIGLLFSLNQSASALRISSKTLQNEIDESKERRKADAETEKKRQTFRLHEAWISAPMQEIRTRVWGRLMELVESAEHRGGVAYIGSEKSRDAESAQIYYSIGSISHFVADVDALLGAEQIDAKLTEQLLGRSFLQWRDLLKKVRFQMNGFGCTEAEQKEQKWHDAAWGQHISMLLGQVEKN